MTDLELLKKKINESGITMIAISKKTGIVRETLYNRLKGKGEFNVSEIVALTKVLEMSKTERDEIFFGEKAEQNVIVNETEELKKLPDKILHCLARIIQDETIEYEDYVKCLYCKYAIECKNEFFNGIDRTPLWIKLLRLLHEYTFVTLDLSQETKATDILKGSWIEKYPDVLKTFTNKSFDEQLDILKGPDILQYKDKEPCQQQHIH